MAKPFVLIVEDEREIAALFRHVVDMLGYRTEIALDGDIAIDRLSNSQPDIVVLDLNLPGVPGEDIIRQIRNDKRLDNTKIIVVTGYAYIAETLPAEPDLTLLKPVDIEQLSIFIRRFSLPDKKEDTQNPWDKNTGLYNQSFFMKRLDFALRQSIENKEYLFSVLSFKLSQLYAIKKMLDQPLWERMLSEIVDALKSTVRPTDTIASIDQDNFYILIENIPNKDIPMMVATRLEEMLDESLVEVGGGGQRPIGVGITLCDDQYETVEEILQDVKLAQKFANTHRKEQN